MTSVGLDAFQCLCDAANQLERLREDYCEGSSEWTGLTQLVQGIDALIDGLVESEGLDDGADCG